MMSLHEKIKTKGVVYFLITAMSLMLCFGVTTAFAATGSIWSSVDSCGAPQQENFFNVGDTVYVWGTNFPAGTYDWHIEGHGGSSCDQGNVVVSSNSPGKSQLVIAGGEKFCFDAYVAQPGDCGNYKYYVGPKFNMFKIEGAGPDPVGDLEITKVSYSGDDCDGIDFEITVKGPTALPENQQAEYTQTITCEGAPVLWTGLDPGTYEITEAGEPEWELDYAYATVVYASGTTSLEIENRNIRSGIDVEKTIYNVTGPDQNGWYSLLVDIDVENIGAVELGNLSVIDILDDFFEDDDWELVGSPTTPENPYLIQLNGGYDGTSSNEELIAADQTLGTGDNRFLTIRMNLKVKPASLPETYTNVVDASGGEEQQDQDSDYTTIYPESSSIPTLSEWGMIIFSLMLAGSAIWMMRRRRHEI